MNLKDLKVQMFVSIWNRYGFKHHPENELRKKWSANGKDPWVDPRFRFHHRNGKYTPLVRITQIHDMSRTKNEEILEEDANEHED